MTSLHERVSALERLPADQRAVLQLVLARGHSYDEIARMLSIDRAAVRQRALAALDLLGPATRVSPQRRALITDYLLGQLPARVTEEVRGHLALSDGERAWARVVAAELSPLSAAPLPEIPSGALGDGPAPAGSPRPVSRIGGAILLGAVAAAAIAAILIFVVLGTGSGGSHAHKATVSRPTTGATTQGSPKPLVQVNLHSPTHARTAGIAQIFKAGNKTGVLIYAVGLAPNAHGDAYAIWLYNSPRSAYRLGYVNPGVGADGRLETGSRLPANAGSFKQIVVALQHGASNTPGKIVLAGPLSGLQSP